MTLHRIADPATRGARRLARTAALGLALLAAAGPAGAEEHGASGGEAAPQGGPSVSGDYILLDPVFVSVVDEQRDRSSVMGLIIRLQPNPERRLEACYAVPRLIDALVVDFYETRLTREQQTAKGHGPVRKRVEEIAKRVAGPDVISSVSIFDQMPELDETSAKLSRACK